MIAEAQPAPPIPAWLRDRMRHADERVLYQYPDGTQWRSNAGPQTWLQLCPCDEILYGGRRGGGKSQGLLAWMASGDPDLSEDDPARWSHLNESSFRGIFLREKVEDLKDFIDEAREFYRGFGVRPVGQPVRFEFSSGAIIYTGHLKDENAFNKYRGWALVRIGIEELAQIKRLNQYLKLLGSLRPKKAGVRYYDRQSFPALRTQIVSTSNPDGPGAPWITARFVDVMADGQMVPPNTPMRDPVTGLWRIYIPAGLKDNPYLANDLQYNAMLRSQDEVTQRQWIHGDWHAQRGKYFRDYRPHGPVGEKEATETPWARHLIDRVELKPWWHRWGSGDWGYDHPAAFLKYCRNEADGRLHVYDELLIRQISSFEMGATLARWWSPDLDGLPDHCVTLYLSHDAFLLRKAYDEPTTRAEQIQAGMRSVLGPFGALILHYDHDEQTLAAKDEAAAARAFERRRKEFEGRVSIRIKRANPDRIGGFSFIRDLLRFRPIEVTQQPDQRYMAAVLADRGQGAYEAELAKWRSMPDERADALKGRTLPGIQVWKICKALDYCLRNAIYREGTEDIEKWNHDPDANMPGDDALESLRNGANAYKAIRAEMPRSFFVQEKMAEAQRKYTEQLGSPLTDPVRLAQIEQFQAARFEQQKRKDAGGSITLPRGIGSRRKK